MDNLISKQAAIDALADYIHNVDKVYSTGHLSMSDCEDAARSVIEDLPSAQPDIIRCKDCKYNTSSHKCLQPDSFFLVPADDFYCGYAERRTDEQTKL